MLSIQKISYISIWLFKTSEIDLDFNNLDFGVLYFYFLID